MEKKTAEEILESTAGHPIDAMYQFSNQQLSELKDKLKEKIIGERDWTTVKLFELIDSL